MDTEITPYVHVKNLRSDSDYKQLHSLFSEYGRIQKLFYKPDLNYANVYYETPEEVLAVIEASRYKSWKAEQGNNQNRSQHMQRSRSRCRDKSPFPRRSILNHSHDNTYLPKEYNMSDDQELESVNQVYVDVHGNPLKVFKLKDGDFLVPLSEVRRTGFNIFKQENYNKLLVADEQLTEEFYLHLLAEAQSFLIKNKVSCVDASKIEDAIEKVRLQLLNSKPLHSRRSSTSSNQNISALSNSSHIDKTDIATDTITQEKRRYSNESYQQNNHYKQQNGDSGRLHEQVRPRNSFHQTSEKPKYDSNTRHQTNDMNPFLKTRQYKSEGNNVTITSSFRDSCSDKSNNVERRSLDNKNCSPSVVKVAPNLTVDAPQHPPPIQTGLRKPNVNLQKTAPSEPPTAVNPTEETRNQITLERDFQMVKITYMENPQCCWVNLEAHSDMIDCIILDVADAEESCKVVEPIVGNLVIAEYEDVWCRASVVQTNPLKVLFIDYGNSEVVKCVKSIPKSIAAIPAQAVKVEFDDLGGKVLAMDMKCKIRAVEKKDNGYLVSFKEKSQTPKKKEPTAFYRKPNLVSPMKDKDMVMIIGATNGQLYVRTKECYQKFKEISEKLSNLPSREFENLTDVKIGQIVLAIIGNEIRRAVVTDVTSNISIEFLDYPGEENLPLSAIKSIGEYFASQPSTFIGTPHLEGVTKFGDKGSELLFDLIQNRAKLTVVLNDKLFDLMITGTQQLLSTKIKELDTVATVNSGSDIIKYEDMPYHELKMGVGSFMFFSVSGADDMTIIPTQGVKQFLEDLADVTDTDGKPYKPQELEMCIGLYQDSWYRCVNKEENPDGSYEVMFVDYGNQATLTAKDLRKLSSKMAAIPIIGNLCFLDDVPHDVEKIDMKIKSLLPDGEILEVEVKEFDGIKYKIHVPSITQKLKEAHLI